MADVYLARDMILERDVAIKVLRLEFANDQEFIARFDREAQAATSLSHPNIVSIYDVGEEDHILYMVMEYVDGMTLKEYIQRFGPIEVVEAIDIMKQITAAIAHAHENAIVHRDIKPQNIMINSYGQIKVTDFGIAVALSATALTQTNTILGSVHYLSPEQARGGLATKKSDIYSLGIVFYELLTGKLPFSGQSPVAIALKHLQSDTPFVRDFNPDIPQSVENIVLKAMAKDPFQRFSTVYEMQESLEAALDPSRANDPRFFPAVSAGEETKAIPIITDNIPVDESDDTIIHQPDMETKEVNGNKQNKKASKPKKPKKKKTKQNKKKKWFIILLLILLASAITAAFLIPGIIKPKDVTIPDVAGKEYEDAVDQLEALNLHVRQEKSYSEKVDEGIVIRTDPHKGKTVKEDSTITVVVSQGKEKEEMADYVGRDYEQTKAILQDNEYEDVIAYEKYSDRPKGEIINQIQPTPGTKVIPSETKVIFEISIGPELINLNNLKGMTETEAKQYLEANGLKMNKIEENSDTVPKGQVIKQNPDSNTDLEKGETVDVYVSIGPEEKPPASHTVTFTVPYNPDAADDDKRDDEHTENKPQTVKIYIRDMEHDISEVYKEDTITKDKEYTITLTIAPDSDGEYKVMRDDELIINKTVGYKEGE
ncbi:Stk1 family PASTA domain-containing Ser/Thr kinase [Virgibacillus sp. 179-BFC.A HS]|uniref:non-specific serine/threonine protein kinase n=1 Tax=Tigheibacillus jepli TaxID=3035914 RepID=A0ABU5CKA6_9BACI|nr:Stk1 family PASTA domain-containing Ser/Thr kinase [Virgibacillus sp. 179-BFC.A HS]MDY0405925.1 Stk1 family PASTA domain-containing Ser/Thr kinase [Virgibacillus sp. 179-BFC.A HS]